MPSAQMSGYREALELDERRQREGLIRASRDLERRMGVLASRLEEGNAVVNELGELQASGPALDVRCAAYVAAHRALRDYDAFAEAESVAS